MLVKDPVLLLKLHLPPQSGKRLSFQALYSSMSSNSFLSVYNLYVPFTYISLPWRLLNNS